MTLPHSPKIRKVVVDHLPDTNTPFSFLPFDTVEVSWHVNVDVGVASGMISALTNMLSGGKRACIQSNFDVDVDVDVDVIFAS